MKQERIKNMLDNCLMVYLDEELIEREYYESLARHIATGGIEVASIIFNRIGVCTIKTLETWEAV